ncbi:MAG: hypothetical protein V3T77_09885, partial [Planctomycetota bacterium]
EHVHALPANARHDQFRVRFLCDVHSADDLWYVDSVTVSDGPPPQGNILKLEDVTGSPGTPVESRIFATHADMDIAGYSLSVKFAGEFLDVTDLILAGTDSEGAELIYPNLSNAPDPGSYWTIGVVLDVESMLVIPAGEDNTLVRARYLVEDFAPLGTRIDLIPEQDVANPQVEIIFASPEGFAFFPSTAAGSVTVTRGTGLFVRGDGNRDGLVDVADPIFNLDYQFNKGPTFCLDAQDTNDDGQINLADPIYNLSFQFADGSAPPLPFPNAGSDPTEDTLDCGG